MSKLLFIVDVQNDFVSGTLAVPGAADVVQAVKELVTSGDYDYIWASKDWHPENHFSFNDEPQFVDGSWPPHCVSATWGSDFASDVIWKHTQRIFYKGFSADQEAYSAFDGMDAYGIPLQDRLDRLPREMTDFDVVGLATDYCVKATAIDAATSLFFPTVLLNATRPVTVVGGMQAVAAMAAEGVKFE